MELEVVHDILYKHVTCISLVNDVKTVVLRRFNMEYTWCVCGVHYGNGEGNLSKELPVHLVKNSTFQKLSNRFVTSV